MSLFNKTTDDVVSNLRKAVKQLVEVEANHLALHDQLALEQVDISARKSAAFAEAERARRVSKKLEEFLA